jgi:single-strand DNA-binding protein
MMAMPGCCGDTSVKQKGSMAMKNSFDVTGRVGSSELKQTEGGKLVLRFSIAESVYFGGEEHDPHWWDCEVWGERASALETLVTKGQILHVRGWLRQHAFTPKDSEKPVRAYTVTVDELEGFTGFSKWGAGSKAPA